MMKEPKGFFMMMGAVIDQACHDNDHGTLIQEIDFDNAVKVAMTSISNTKETLIIITADQRQALWRSPASIR